MKKLVLLAAVALPGCIGLTEDHVVDSLTVIHLPPPSIEQLDYWRRHEPWRTDVKRMAHDELQLVKDIPFSGQAYDPAIYEFHESNVAKPEWGSYVVRGWSDRSGRLWRWRVKVSQDRGLWYAREISHYISASYETEH